MTASSRLLRDFATNNVVTLDDCTALSPPSLLFIISSWCRVDDRDPVFITQIRSLSNQVFPDPPFRRLLTGNSLGTTITSAHSEVRPSRMQNLVNPAMLRMPSLPMICLRCVSTVLTLTTRHPAISFVDLPSPISCNTCNSRWVSR